MLDIQDARNRYNIQKWHTQCKKDRNGMQVEMRLTFEEWLDIWQQSGKWDLRGRKSNQYVMARKDDYGHYELGNVIIQSQAENCATRNKHVKISRKGIKNPMYGKKHSDITKQKISAIKRGML